ncbi:GNAT family N-acetyltransferase [Paenibacillus shenyangensis]|uniref:GNAT family N-acetyltransferase n=1 Tax=Paenibacillus sp. A9 TaxID=1284352 RepID=UPI00036026C5|nr:GNAT family N-acetyltransferase [Paenibacillus sp. A9]
MITLRKITLENRRDIFNLEVLEEQKKYVASNLSSVASCYVLSINGGNPFPLAIYAEEQPVGFVMITYGITGYDLPRIAEGNYCILRLMIDQQYQNKGYGRKAMERIIEFIRTYPAGPAEYCWIPYSPDNTSARKLYESFGFRDNGEICHDELITVLQL